MGNGFGNGVPSPLRYKSYLVSVGTYFVMGITGAAVKFYDLKRRTIFYAPQAAVNWDDLEPGQACPVKVQKWFLDDFGKRMEDPFKPPEWLRDEGERIGDEIMAGRNPFRQGIGSPVLFPQKKEELAPLPAPPQKRQLRLF